MGAADIEDSADLIVYVVVLTYALSMRRLSPGIQSHPGSLVRRFTQWYFE